jgi:nicotinamidase-related amidase
MNLTYTHDQFRQRGKPVLVLADLHHGPAFVRTAAVAAALERCHAALAHARALGFPIAFVRQVKNSGLFGETKRYPAWLEGFEPHRADMVFDHTLPSCYDSAEFAQMAKHANGNFVLAGLFSELTCLSTAVDAYHRGQSFVFLSDASAPRGRNTYNGSQNEAMDHAITHIISHYTDVANTSSWITATSLNGGVTYGA